MMKTLLNRLLSSRLYFLLGLSLLVVLAACEEDDGTTVDPEPEPTALELAQETDQLSSLVDAVNRAGLADALSDDDNPVTIFALNNSAFAQFLADNEDFSSLDDIPEDVLADVLRYHVVAGRTLSSELTEGEVPTLLTSENLTITLDNGVMLNGNVRVVNRTFMVNIGAIRDIQQYANGRLKLTVDPPSSQDIIVSREKVSFFKAWLNT